MKKSLLVLATIVISTMERTLNTGNLGPYSGPNFLIQDSGPGFSIDPGHNTWF